MKKIVCVAAVALAAIAGTWLGGWWAVAIVAFAAGCLACSPALVAAGCAAGWLVLLLADALAGSIGRVADALGGVMGLPPIALFAVTLALPALLGWSAALLGNAARSLRPTSRQPS